MTDTPTPEDPTVVPLRAERVSAAPLGVQSDLVILLERALSDAKEGKVLGGIVILMGHDGACYSNSAGAFTYANAIAQLALFQAQLEIQCLVSNGQLPSFLLPAK